MGGRAISLLGCKGWKGGGGFFWKRVIRVNGRGRMNVNDDWETNGERTPILLPLVKRDPKEDGLGGHQPG